MGCSLQALSPAFKQAVIDLFRKGGDEQDSSLLALADHPECPVCMLVLHARSNIADSFGRGSIEIAAQFSHTTYVVPHGNESAGSDVSGSSFFEAKITLLRH